ncbi:unnamed protein product [Triticum aestivum]|uniref:Uncharacterized protein n=1 Tax=Triticum aestivum TaxID=4565 RepID=A0A7H4LBJ4_WHEAT|nr:unnamed protein product [Triticum aestivum]
MEDNDGNTALHLAIQAGSLLMFRVLLRNQKVNLNISNKKGQTALDVSRYKIPPGLFNDQKSGTKIHFALKVVNARSGGCRRDHFEEKYNQQLKHNEREEFDAFIIASTFSFILFAMSMVGLIYSGYPIFNPHSRRIYLLVALYFGSTSITCFTTAFAVG